MVKIILASGSAYRKTALEKNFPSLQVEVSGINEEKLKEKIKDPVRLVRVLAIKKAKKISEKTKSSAVIISADTLVVFKDKIIGKAKNRQEARKILNLLKDQTHEVLTGFCVINKKTKEIKADVEMTRVSFRNFNDEELERFLNSGDWQGKAGAYGLQSKNFKFLKKFEGDYENILGLPSKLAVILKEFGVKIKER